MTDSRLEFLVLGPLDVRVGAVSVRVGGPKQRALLALLLLSANRVVSRDRLIRELQGEQSAAADHVLRVQVSRLRKTLAPDGAGEPRLVARAPGYLLRVEPGELDLDLFEQRVAEGTAALEEGDPARAASLLRSAESLWRGRPLADLEFEPFARVDVERLEELRLAALEERVDAELALGRHAALVPELESVIAEQPLRERLRAQLMLALYRCGRQAEGLAVYRRTREHLNVELGLEPGVALQQLEKAILVQDPALDVPPRSEPASRQVRDDTGRPVCPFKGLAAFEAVDAEFFFGRERLVGELVARLADATVLAVVGPSGSGKSSLLRAGLLPALAAEELPAGGRRRQVLLRPGPQPATELARAVTSGLPDAIADLRPGERMIVAIDQFEEAFTVCQDDEERQAFIDALVEAAWDPERRCVVLLALRADFFGRLAAFPELAELVGANHLLLGPMSSRELRRAIEGPAERADLLIEPGLVEALVGDVAGEPGGLPLLSTALLDLWEQRQGRSLRLQTYEQMGRVQGAVAAHAEAAYGRLSEEERQTARRLMLRLAAGGGAEPVTRRRVALAELDHGRDEGAARVLAALTDSRLLTASDEAVEVAHEALLGHWPRFRDWLAEDAEGRGLHRHLTQAAADWTAAGRDAGELYRGARLGAALEWAETADNGLALNELEREFLDHSRVASASESERQRRVNRRLRVLLGGALALLLVALAAGAIALQQRREARQQATAAVAGRLGTQALIEPGLDRSLLLAREAVNLDDSAATRDNLLAALLRSPAALAVLHGKGDRALDEALSPDGRTLAVGGDDGSVVLIDTRTLRRSGRRYTGDSQISMNGAITKPIHALAFSPNGRTLAIGSTTGSNATLFLLETRTRNVLAGVTSFEGVTTADVAFAPDGRTLVTGEATSLAHGPPDEVIVLRNAKGTTLAKSRPIPGGRVGGFSPDGRFVLISQGASRSLLLEARTLKPVKSFLTGGVAAVSPVAEAAAFGHDDGTVTLVDLDSGELRKLSGRAGESIQALSFGADGKVLASADADGSLAVWDVVAGRLGETFQGHSTAASGVALSPDGTTLYSASFDGSVIVWDVSGERRLGQRFVFDPGGQAAAAAAPESRSASTAVAVTPDGSIFATSPAPGRVTLRHSRTPLRDARELRGPVAKVTSLAFSRDGRLLAATGFSATTVVWDVTTGKLVQTLRGGDSDGSGAAAFSLDDVTLAAADFGGNVNLYDLRTGARVGRLSAGSRSLVGIDFSPDGTLVAAANLAGGIYVWNIARRELVRTMFDPVAIYALRFSPDGKLLASGDHSGNVVFWDVTSGRPLGRPLSGHNGPAYSVSFGRGGKVLVTVGGDGKLRLWDVESRKLIGTPLPGSDTGGWGLFFPDGKHVISVFGSGVGVIWNVDPVAWEARACQVAHRNLTRIEWSNYLPSESFRKVCS